jgi:hypothetical protein
MAAGLAMAVMGRGRIERDRRLSTEAGTRPVGNDQLNDVCRDAQVEAQIECPVTVHGSGTASTTSPGSKVCRMRW